MGRYDCDFPSCCDGWVPAEKAGGHRGDERRPCPKCSEKRGEEPVRVPGAWKGQVEMSDDFDAELQVCTICEKQGQTYPRWGDICASCAVSKAMMMLNDALKELGHHGL